MDYYRNKYMNEKGITLIALAITIVVLLILAGITIATLTGDNGIITQAQKAKDETDKAYYKEQLELASLKYINGEIKFEDILNTEDFKFEEYFNGSKSKVIKTKEGFYFTILEDGTVLEGKLAYLDIVDGSIDIKSTGFIQGTLTAKTAYHMNGEFIPYEGDYIITGETKENAVRIWEQGTYNITIKNLKIDLAELGGIQALCAFNGNRGQSATGVYVNLKLEENNYLCGYSAPGLGFGRATPNVNGVTNGSTLIIEGEGRLEAIGTGIASGIGSGYTGWDSAAGDANNIIINSGNIVATAGTNACAIGSSLRQNVNNLIINGGNIIANASNRFGIGAVGTLDNLMINGGNIIATGGEYGGAIGGYEGSGEIRITGGVIHAYPLVSRFSRTYATIGNSCASVKIEGGTIICKSPEGTAFGSNGITNSVEITGGSTFINAVNGFAVPPINGENNVYLTEIQLENVKGQTKIDNLTTSDNLNYNIKDMYTTEEGKLYLYLPEGTRTINITIGGKTYTGTVQTTASDSSNVVILK